MANSIRICLLSTCLFIASLLSACGPLDDPSLSPAFDANNAAPIPEKVSSQYNEDRNLYWGDLHIHTSYSTDAYTMGVRATPEDKNVHLPAGQNLPLIPLPVLASAVKPVKEKPKKKTDAAPR